MARFGFIHSKLDTKLLILYILTRVAGPIDFATLTDLVMCDDGVDYFEFAEALSELLESGHLVREGDYYSPTDKGRRLKIFYLTQASTRPPTFVAFVNSKPLFHFSYQRYLINQIRESFSLEHTPIRLVVRERGTGQVGAKDV